jgi:hypothetical protein
LASDLRDEVCAAMREMVASISALRAVAVAKAVAEWSGSVARSLRELESELEVRVMARVWAIRLPIPIMKNSTRRVLATAGGLQASPARGNKELRTFGP